MSTGYQIHDQTACHYLTFQIIDWIDVFSRKRYRDIIVDSLDFCRKNKGLKLWTYVIMTNHIHAIMSTEGHDLSDVIRDFKNIHPSGFLNQSTKNLKAEEIGC